MTGKPFEVPAVSRNVAAPLPYAPLVQYTNEDLDLPTSGDDAEMVVQEAKEAKREMIDSASLRKVSRDASVIPAANFGKAPAFQDAVNSPQRPPTEKAEIDAELAERLRRRLRDGE